MYIAIEGVIGVGKTSLARLLQAGFDAELVLEAFEENPFLADFYGDRDRYAFQTQIFFLLSRYRQQRELIPVIQRSHVISDYTFAKDSLFAQLTLRGDELATYHLVYEALAEGIPRPDLVVYLRATTETAMQRIAKRDRPYERDMDQSYINQVNQSYETFYAHPHKTKTLVIDSNTLDFVADDDHLAYISNRIRSSLGIAPYQPELPLEE